MAYRTEILGHIEDGRAKTLENKIQKTFPGASVRIVDVYMSENNLIQSDSFTSSVCNPVTQSLNKTPTDFTWALEIGFLPGVTDNIGHTASELLTLAGANDNTACYSAQLFLISGDINENDIKSIAADLHNPLIQRATIKNQNQFTQDGGMGITIPQVHLSNQNTLADEIDLNIDDAGLEEIGNKGIKNPDGSYRGPLGLSLADMKTIQSHYKNLGRNPTDVELETLAQTWSEHCKHTIFASPIDDVKDGLYKHYIKRATQDIRAARGENDICVSVFSDNAGAIIFDDNYLITDKVETHNSPSALDPFGGAITGIVGVNRDCIGFGQGAKPILNRYGFCLADPRTDPKLYRDPKQQTAILSPETIMNGVIAGVEAGGNCSGIPTPQGFVYFNDDYVGKPLVFVGTIGLIPREINNKPSHEKGARPGDKIIMAGGRVGRDGIHGATFSSVALDEGSPATAVQIGDPITQKKMSDAIIKEIRDLGLYSAITDNGAGGLSSSVGEMAEVPGGFHLELEKVPLKYPGMAPWEIWISESQERMTIAAPEENCDKIIEIFAKRGVEATIVGTFTETGNAHITYDGQTVMDMTMDFLHDGNPVINLETTFTPGGTPEPELNSNEDHAETLLDIMARPNIASKEFISTQYDHNVQGSACIPPLQGPGRVYAETTISKPVFESDKGVVLSQGLFPLYSHINTYHMATASLDLAVRNAVAAGVDYNQLALLDNFCWCSSDEPQRLGQLKKSAEAIYEAAVHYGTPFISGKDSMFNDFKGFDDKGQSVKISAPPTLLISSIGVIPDIEQSISLSPKAIGDLVYIIGETKDELGGSEYYDHMGQLGTNVPETNLETNHQLYRYYSRAARKNLIASAIAVHQGGLAVALAKKAIAGQMGMDIDLSHIDLPLQKALYSESTGRILVTIAPQNKEKFEKEFKNFKHLNQIGHVAHTENLNINNKIKLSIQDIENKYKNTFKGY